MEGGEYNKLRAVWTNLGAIYNPKTNKWKQVTAPAGWSSIGDAQGVILNDGTYMQSNCCTTQFAYFNPKGSTWTAFNGNGKFDVFDEEGFNLLPNGKVLTVDAYVFQYDPAGMNSELYDPSTQTWSSAGSTQVQLWDDDCGSQGMRLMKSARLSSARWHGIRDRGQLLRPRPHRHLQHRQWHLDGRS